MSQRGQATVELALGVLLFIPVLLLGIHFAEVGMITLRVNQAANSAVWDTTAVRMHTFNSGANFYNANQMLDGSNQAPGPRAQALYQNFDGLASGGTGSINQVVTSGTQLQVSCRPSRVMTTAITGPISASYGYATGPGGGKVDGMSCSAEGKVNAFNMPTNFVEGGGGLFNAPMVNRATFKVCAIGRANGGNCNGKLEVALDDWALSGSDSSFGNELQNCGVLCLTKGSGNQAYLKTVKRVFDAYNPNFVADPNETIHDFIVTLFTSTPSVPQLANVPVNETDFRFAFVGEEGDLGETSPVAFKLPTREANPNAPIDYHWETTPASDAYGTAYGNRGECFLGSKCAEPVFAKGTW